ncbi:MAG: hypothetical protein HC806_02255 [Anaerolineae bacterium]|nr:hypothetical protein [Anaerolineae bacterium]
MRSCFEGGGAKGILFVGALEEFEARGHTVGRLIGTSAGAITATLLAAGYTPAQMKEVVIDRLPNGKPRFPLLWMFLRDSARNRPMPVCYPCYSSLLTSRWFPKRWSGKSTSV